MTLPVAGSPTSAPPTSGVALRPMWQVEREMIEAAMAECSDNVHRAAALLEISPSTIYRRIRDEETAET